MSFFKSENFAKNWDKCKQLLTLNIWIYLTFFLVLIFPTNVEMVYSGLPLKDSFIFFTFLSLLYLGLFYGLTNRFEKNFAKKDYILLGFLLFVLGIKSILFYSDSSQKNLGYEGFKARIYFPQGMNKHKQLAFSYDFPFQGKGVEAFTRFDKTIDFDRNWNLGFLNQIKTTPNNIGSYIRERVPLRVHWTGEVDLTKGDNLQLSYIGEGFLKIGSKEIVLEPSYSQLGISRFEVAQDLEGKQLISLIYTYDDGSKWGAPEESFGKLPLIKLLKNNDHLTTVKREGHELLKKIVFVILSFFILLFVLKFFSDLFSEHPFHFFVLVGLITFYGFFFGFIQKFSFFILFSVTVLVSKYWLEVKKVDILVASSFCFLAFLLFFEMDVNSVVLFDTYGDATTYELMARKIFLSVSLYEKLKGGEALFYYQPLYRYLLPYLNLLFGDANTKVFIFFLYQIILILGLSFLYIKKYSNIFIAIVSSYILYQFSKTFIWYLAFSGMSETPGWIFTFLGFFMLLKNPRSLWAVFFLGLSTITRINFIIGNYLILLVFFLLPSLEERFDKGWFFSLIQAHVVYTGLFLLVPLHNVVFGHELVWTTNSSGIKENVTFPLSNLLSIFNDDGIRKQFLYRIVKILFIDIENISQTIKVQWMLFSLNVFYFFAIFWQGFKVRKVIKKDILKNILKNRDDVFIFLVMLVPFAYNFLYIRYNLKAYYPRQIIMSQYFMVLLVFLPFGDLFKRVDIKIIELFHSLRSRNKRP